MRLSLLVAVLALAFLPARASAQRLPGTVSPDHYDLAFVIDLSHTRFEGTETIRARVLEPTAKVVLHAVDLKIEDVTIGVGGDTQPAAVTFDAAAQTATFTVPRPLARGAVDIKAKFSGVLNDQLRGLYLSKGRNRSYAVTQFESTDARRAFPCFDEPSFKATFALTVTLDRGDTAISNGRPMSNVAGPARTQHTITFSETPRMSTYLVALAVGDFDCLEGAADNVPIRICATRDKKDLGRIALESAEQILHFYNSYYAIRYPFMKLDVLAVPDFAAGAMENTAAIFYREGDLLADTRTASVDTRKQIASVLAHEMAHQWFGDLVTMAWWDDIWLNEGFATWMANKPVAAAHPDWNIAVDEALETERALTVDSLAATRPIHVDVEAPAQIDEAFDTITYEKGAAVLRMVEQYVGAEAFRRGINAYLQTHAYKNATSEDLSKAIAAVSGKPVERILPTFVNQLGVPLVSVSLSCANNQTSVALRQERFPSRPGGAGGSGGAGGPGGERWQIPICVKAPGQAAATCDLLTEQAQTLALPGSCAPWVFANAGAAGYYRTAYTPDALRAIAPHIGDLTAPERLSLIADEWTVVRAGRHGIGEYLTLAAGYGREHASGVLGEVADRLAFVRQYLTTDADRTKFEGFVRTLFRPLFDELGLTPAPSESDDRRELRAEVVEALGMVANDPDVVARLRGAVDRALSGAVSMDAALAGSAIRAAAAHGDAALFDALAAAGERAVSPDEHYRYVNAMAEFRDPALIDRGLQRVLSPAVRSQDAAQYLAAFIQNPAARRRAWSFLKEQWTPLQPKLGIYGADTTIATAVSAFCDPSDRDDVAAFFKAHPLPGAVRTLEQSLERIDGCIALKTTQGDAVAKWLATR